MVLLWEVTEEFLFYVPPPNGRWPRPSISNPQPSHRRQPGKLIPYHQGSLEALMSRIDLEPCWAKSAARESALFLEWPGHFQAHQGNTGMVGGTGRRDSDITSRLSRKYLFSCGPQTPFPHPKMGLGRWYRQEGFSTARVWPKKPFCPFGPCPFPNRETLRPFPHL